MQARKKADDHNEHLDELFEKISEFNRYFGICAISHYQCKEVGGAEQDSGSHHKHSNQPHGVDKPAQPYEVTCYQVPAFGECKPVESQVQNDKGEHLLDGFAQQGHKLI